MKTPEQLKGMIRNMAVQKNLQAQEVLQMFFFERILERLSASPFRSNFILKGGLLISSMLGISERTTMDMDTTVRGIQMEESDITAAMERVLSVDIGDEITFLFEKIEPIREDDDYNNFRVHLRAKYGRINTPMKIDITTGDVITPSAVQYDFPLAFEDKTVPVMAYSLETVLAEKYETILRRNIGNTRARDFYDLHILYRSYKEEIRMDDLKLAVAHTAKKRGSEDAIRDWNDILKEIREEQRLYRLWNRYVAENRYIGELSFHTVLDTVEQMAMAVSF